LPELQELADWTLDPRDPANPRSAPRVNSRRMDLLNDVVAHEDALAAFRSGSSIDHAHRLTGAETTALLDALNDVSVALTNALALVNRLEQRPTSEHRAAAAFVHEQLGQLSDALDAAQARADGSAGSSAV
jgi:hypothetical protein